MLHRSVAGAVLFSICHFAAAETEKFDFWGLTSPTYLGDPSDDKFWESLLDGTPILSTHYENILSDAYWNDAEYASEVLNYGFINQNLLPRFVLCRIIRTGLQEYEFCASRI